MFVSSMYDPNLSLLVSQGSAHAHTHMLHDTSGPTLAVATIAIKQFAVTSKGRGRVHSRAQ
jgi:hypothetical protein